MKKNKLTFAVRKEEKWLTAQCIEFPSVATQGRNHKELMAMISDAVDGYFSAFPEEKERLESLEKAKVIEITISVVPRCTFAGTIITQFAEIF